MTVSQQAYHHNNISHRLLLETKLSVLNPVSHLVLSPVLVNNKVQCPHLNTWENWGFKRLRKLPNGIWLVSDRTVWDQVPWIFSSCHSAFRILTHVQQLSSVSPCLPTPVHTEGSFRNYVYFYLSSFILSQGDFQNNLLNFVKHFTFLYVFSPVLASSSSLIFSLREM